MCEQKRTNKKSFIELKWRRNKRIKIRLWQKGFAFCCRGLLENCFGKQKLNEICVKFDNFLGQNIPEQ
jgi:hypothetical protein